MDDGGDSDDGVEEGVGESSWPAGPAGPAASSSSSGLVASGGANGNGPLSQDVRKGIYHRLRDIGNEEALSDPFFEQLLDEHYERLPASYSIDLNVERAEDVLLHRRILAECAHPDKRPVFHARFLRFQEEKPKDAWASTTAAENGNGGGPLASPLRGVEFQEFPCERMMEDLSLGKRKGVGDFEAISAWSVSSSNFSTALQMLVLIVVSF